MTDKAPDDLSKKMNVLIALSLRQLLGDKDFSRAKRKKGVGDLVHYLDGKRLLRALIGEVTVTGDEIVVRGPEPALAETADAARRSEDFPLSAVHISDREWRALGESNPSCKNENLES